MGKGLRVPDQQNGARGKPLVRATIAINAPFRVVGAWKNQEARKHCTFTRQSSNVFCVQLAVAGPDDPALGGGVIV
jgi:hypothetical protein